MPMTNERRDRRPAPPRAWLLVPFFAAACSCGNDTGAGTASNGALDPEQPVPPVVAPLDGDGASSAGPGLELQRADEALTAGDLDAAAAHLEAALALDPNQHEARGKLGLLRLRAGDVEASRKLLRAACEGFGADSPMRIGLLGAVINIGNWAETEALVDALLAGAPEDPVLVFARGRVQAGQGRFKAAAEDFARVATLDPTHESAPTNEARALLALGDEVGAAAVLEAARERLPASRLVKQRLAWLLATARDEALVDGPRASALAKQVLAESTKNPEYLSLAAAAFAAAGEFIPAELHERLAMQTLEGLPEAQAPMERAEILAQMALRHAEYQAGRRWREPAPKATEAPGAAHD